jgi:hypothetical protein
MAALQKIVELGRGLLTAAGVRLSPHANRAIERICLCRTAALGGHIQACPEGHVERRWYNSCKHRSCPECNFTSVERWLARQKIRLLRCDYYHIIFTLPHELNPLWLSAVGAMTQLLFGAIRDTLFELLGDPGYLGAEPGLIVGLHTWGQNASLHPHGHCLVTGGGMTPGGLWRAAKNGYLLPGRVARDLFRGKMLAALRRELTHGRLALPAGEHEQRVLNLFNKLGRKKWNVCIRERYGHGRGVLTYLGRYLRGGPMSNRRIVSFDSNRVRFRYRDYRDDATDGKKRREMELSTDEFLRRLMLHVPEPGRKVIRSYGICAGSRRRDLEKCREFLGQEPIPEPETLTWQDCLSKAGGEVRCRCPVCGAFLVEREVIAPRHVGMNLKFPLRAAG